MIEQKVIIGKTLRVPRGAGPAGDGGGVARQLVALPIVFARADDGTWSAKWLHLYLSGNPRFKRVEGNRVSTSMLARAIIERDYLTVSHLIDLLHAKAATTTAWEPNLRLTEPVTFIGLHRPDNLPAESTVITLDRLNQLIPR